MNHIRFKVLEFLNHAQYYLLCQKQKAQATRVLQKSVLNSIKALSHQDLVTYLPSGDNLFVHLIKILSKKDALHSDYKFLLSALIKQSLMLHVISSYPVNATIFLLTSSDTDKQTPLQFIDSLQIRGLFDFYFELIERHVSKDYMTHLDEIYRYQQDVISGKQTPWRCPSVSVHLFFDQVNESSFRFLDKLILPAVEANQFIAALDVLRAAAIRSDISNDVYKNLLLTHPKKGYSLLHELSTAGDVDKYDAYLNNIELMYQYKIIRADEYKAMFCCMNNAGYSAVHQAVNSPSSHIAHYFLNWLETCCTLSANIRHDVMRVSSESKGRIKPRRDPELHEDASSINRKVTKLTVRLGEQIRAQSPRRQGLFSNKSLRINTALELDSLSLGSSESSLSSDASSWSPWNSPLLYSPTNTP